MIRARRSFASTVRVIVTATLLSMALVASARVANPGSEGGREIARHYDDLDLSEQQVVIMEGLRARKPLKAIADDLGVAIGSISVQQIRAQRKLGTTNRFDALRRWERVRGRYVASENPSPSRLKI